MVNKLLDVSGQGKLLDQLLMNVIKIISCIEESIREAADLAGFEKLMWGSDYPRTMTAITYKMSLDFVEKTNEISEADKKRFLGENAKQFYGFGDLAVPKKIRNMVEDD